MLFLQVSADFPATDFMMTFLPGSGDKHTFNDAVTVVDDGSNVTRPLHIAECTRITSLLHAASFVVNSSYMIAGIDVDWQQTAQSGGGGKFFLFFFLLFFADCSFDFIILSRMAISSFRPSCSLLSIFSISSVDIGTIFDLSSSNRVVFTLSLFVFFDGVSITDVFALSTTTGLDLGFSSLLIISYDNTTSPIGRSSSPSSYNCNVTSVINVGTSFRFNW